MVSRGARLRQHLLRLDTDRHLGARPDEDEVEVAGFVDEDVGAPRHARLGPVRRPFEDRKLLAGQDERAGPVGVEVHPPRLRNLVAVGRPDHPQARDGPQRGEMLDRLVCRPVLPEADRVV
jgi:hypothetical protein